VKVVRVFTDGLGKVLAGLCDREMMPRRGFATTIQGSNPALVTNLVNSHVTKRLV
jgi:hypothetical protein